MLVQYLLAVYLLLNVSFALPVQDSTTEALVIISDETFNIYRETRAEHRLPELKSIQVVTNVRNRYAHTVVTSKYTNPDTHAQEATFSIVLPDTAFIAGFVMEIEGKQYEAYVRDKTQAKIEYQQAISQGLGAAHVAVETRDTNRFTVSVNIEPQSKVIFILTYEELLVRKHGMYEIVINLHPGQLLKDLGVDVNIDEIKPILNVEIPALRYGLDTTVRYPYNDYVIKEDKNNVIHVSFHPTVDQQRQMARALKKIDEIKGISAQFIVKYDVERDPSGGEVLVKDGYFVHFFAPSELKPIPKHIVFVLDVSGNMHATKIEQLREAMTIILGQLGPNDYFNLVKFNSDVQVLGSNNTWSHVVYPKESKLPQGFAANEENIQSAQEMINKITDKDLPNIYDALIVGLSLTNKGLSNLKVTNDKHKPQPIIVFLTDGQANEIESRCGKIIEMVKENNSKDNKAAVFTLAFGNDANNEFLEEVAIKNSGFSRKIYDAADASLQLQDFYNTISSPLLRNINFKYSENQVHDLTKHKFDILFKGSEIVVAGKIDNYTDKFVTVEGLSIDDTNKFYPTIIPILPKSEVKEEYGSLERLWAYLIIKQLLDKKYDEDENSYEEIPKKQAIQLALKYSFVTPVTSLVVVKPNITESTPAEKNLQSVFESEYDIYEHINSGGGQYNSSGFPLPISQNYTTQYPFPPTTRRYTPPYQFPHTTRRYTTPYQFPHTTRYYTTMRPTPYRPPTTTYRPPTTPYRPPTTPYRPPTTTYRPKTTFHYTPPPSTRYYPTTTRRPILWTTTTTKTTIDDFNDQPIWLQHIITGGGKLTINYKEYEIGNNGTSVEHKTCQVKYLNISGNCTLLTACPKIYHQLDTFESYKTYFCALDAEKYAGVCCPKDD